MLTNKLFNKAFLFALTLCLLAGALVLTGCPMEDDPAEGVPGLDSRLEGTWEFDDAGHGGERCVINGDSFTYGSLSGTGADAVFTETYAGTIVHAESYTNSAGVIIIEYKEGKKQVWNSWQEVNGNYVATPIDPQPTGNFYGIYYHHLGPKDGKLEVFFANTSDQENGYGPTEAETLEAAIEKFTVENMNKYINIDMGEPVHKVN
jgi:hypothetical protein